MKISYDSKKLIEELQNDIFEFGEDKILYAMYEKINDNVFLTNYDFICEEKPLTDKEKKEYITIKEKKAKDILEELIEQDKII